MEKNETISNLKSRNIESNNLNSKERQRIMNKSLLLICIFTLLLALMLAFNSKSGAQTNSAYVINVEVLHVKPLQKSTSFTAEFTTAGIQNCVLNLKSINL